jgi:hypothetical protein
MRPDQPTTTGQSQSIHGFTKTGLEWLGLPVKPTELVFLPLPHSMLNSRNCNASLSDHLSVSIDTIHERPVLALQFRARLEAMWGATRRLSQAREREAMTIPISSLVLKNN